MHACIEQMLRKERKRPCRKGEGLSTTPAPGGVFKSFQHLRRTPEGEAGLFEGIDDLFDACLLVIESDNRDVGELIDLGFIDLATFVRVQLTLSRVKGHSQFGNRSWTTRSLAMAVEAPIRMASTTVISTRETRS